MNGNEAGQILTVLQGAWRSRWTQENEEFWLFELLAFELQESREAIKLLTAEIDYAPSLHQFLDAVHRVRGARRRAEEARRAQLSPAQVENEQQRAASLRLLRMTRSIMGERAMHNHTRGVESCAVCRAHDHSNTTPFGFTRTSQRGTEADREGNVHDVTHSTAVPGWYFDCPRCGNPDAAQHMCDSWSPAGIQWMKLNGRVSSTKRDTAEVF